jgi:hypothetical protein
VTEQGADATMSVDTGDPKASRNGPRFTLTSFLILFACMAAGEALARLHNAGQPIFSILSHSFTAAALVTAVLWFLRLKRPG